MCNDQMHRLTNNHHNFLSSEQISLLFNLGARLLLIFLAFVFDAMCHLKR